MVATAQTAIASKRDYDDLMTEIESVSRKLANARKALWATQDKLKSSELKNEQLELHMSELVTVHEDESKELKELRESNAYLKQEEAKLRESLDLMKKVFTNSHFKSREEQESIAILTEERNSLLEENARLREMHDRNEAPQNVSVLATSLESARAELSEFRRAQMKSERTIRKLRAELRELREVVDSDSISDETFLDRGDKLDRLERRVKTLVQRERDDEVSSDNDSDMDTKVLFAEEMAKMNNFSRNFCTGY
jgi:hypothetical protein